LFRCDGILTGRNAKSMKSSTGILTINLSAIQANWQRINQQIHTGKTSVAGVIKANAYGLGAAQVGAALYQVGCREFFLATLEEALAARTYLPNDAVLYVLGGVRPGAESVFVRHRLVPVLFSMADLDRWRSVCATIKTSADCAIKINTGMTRLGLDMAEWFALLASPKGLDRLNPLLVMSHLACADEAHHSLNHEQLNYFQQIVETSKSVIPNARFSLANSSGIYLGDEWHFDLVRPGAALYGINPQPFQPSPVTSVVQLELPILQVRNLQNQANVGYGATFTANPSTRLAVAAGGYADGLHRTIGRQGVGMIDSFHVPVVGRISMDTTIFDISSVPEALFSGEMPMIQVLNEVSGVDAMTAHTGALGYEILTSLGNRYQRRYILNGRVVQQV
jgi:alanine racemase